jgi:hypothetical protein
MHIITSFPPYFVGFLHSLLVSPTYITKQFAGVIFIPVLATVIFLAAQIIGPVLLNHAVLATPAFDLALAKTAVAAYIVFLVLDTVVFAIKKLILKIVD